MVDDFGDGPDVGNQGFRFEESLAVSHISVLFLVLELYEKVGEAGLHIEEPEQQADFAALNILIKIILQFFTLVFHTESLNEAIHGASIVGLYLLNFESVQTRVDVDKRIQVEGGYTFNNLLNTIALTALHFLPKYIISIKVNQNVPEFEINLGVEGDGGPGRCNRGWQLCGLQFVELEGFLHNVI